MSAHVQLWRVAIQDLENTCSFLMTVITQLDPDDDRAAQKNPKSDIATEPHPAQVTFLDFLFDSCATFHRS